MHRQAHYVNDPTSVAAARAFAREVVAGVAPAIVDRVALVVSELIVRMAPIATGMLM